MEILSVSKSRRDYIVSSSTRKLFFNSIYINDKRMVRGNMKLKNILIFDLPAVRTCLNCSDCKDRCYARKAERMYKNSAIFRETNLVLFLSDKELLKSLIISQLEATKKKVIRLHSSGDFFSQSYINFWNEIIKLFPEKKFYTYTKVDKILDFSEIEKNKNFNLILSYIGDKLNFGSLEYCKGLKKEFKAFICPVTKGVENIKCGAGCTYCVSNKNVCFVEH